MVFVVTVVVGQRETTQRERNEKQHVHTYQTACGVKKNIYVHHTSSCGSKMGIQLYNRRRSGDTFSCVIQGCIGYVLVQAMET
eukprot:216584-Amorphochlora_amoeboformis.AAC.1